MIAVWSETPLMMIRFYADTFLTLLLVFLLLQLPSSRLRGLLPQPLEQIGSQQPTNENMLSSVFEKRIRAP